ncbi:MAG: helix-turn-helix transcriptional regulator [Firmicutes bacterium]|nr:helix-turn-helix transcriptional regulator [Bacillota bacterium]
MKLSRVYQDRKLYFKIFISLILCIILTMTFLSTGLYMYFENFILNQVYSDNINSLIQISRDISAMTDTAEVIDHINSWFYQIFEKIGRKLEENKNSKYEEVIKRFHEIIDSEYGNPALSVESIATALEISPTYMCRLCKQHTLSTILDRIIEIRMKKARELLQETMFSIADIAEKTGFTNSSYFYKTFKKLNGSTPNDFRKNH